jgi:hypothetical protein
MAFFNNGMKVGTGLLIGLGAVVLAPVVVPVVAGVARPLAKAGIKGGLIFLDKAKVLAAEAREAVEDITVEAKSEMAAGGKESGAASSKLKKAGAKKEESGQSS